MTRRDFVQLAGASPAVSAATPRPNVLFLMTDQHRYDALGVNGNRIIRTPNLDRLAAGGANFSRAFVQAPVCVPSRVSYFTGRYPHSHKNRVNYTPADPREVLLQRRFQEAGYQTGAVGKLHYYPPTAEHARSTGWDRVLLHDGVAATDPHSDYVRWRQDNDPHAGRPYNASAAEIPPGGNPFRGATPDEYTPTTWTGKESVRLLREFARSDRPFFLFCSFFKPHAPHQTPPPFDSMYSDSEIPLPRPVTLDEIHKLPLPVQKQILRGAPRHDLDRRRLQWIYRSYYGSVSQVDREIGRILDELDRSGRSSQTIVVFGTDHGDQLLEHGLEGKNVFFEASVHVPFLIRYPGRVASGVRQELIEMVDVAPTLLEFCGLPVPKECQGRSLVPLLTGTGTYQPRSVVFAENIIPEVITSGSLDMPYVPGQGVGGIRHPDAKMARTARWKLTYYPGHGGELYDLENDPGETRNLYRDAAYRARVRELQQALLDWMITADEAEQIAPRWLL
jgi:arylsulfatase A-like enzyme